jgi:hypothetical protein
MKSSLQMKKETRKETGNKNDKKQPAVVKKDRDENKTDQKPSATNTEIESKKSISRWDTDGGTDLCP